MNPATGLTQGQLDEARSDPNNPPFLEGVLDAETGEQLVWRGKPLDDAHRPVYLEESRRDVHETRLKEGNPREQKNKVQLRLRAELPNMLQRFCGPDGRIQLVEALRLQPIVGDDTTIAEAICECAELAFFRPGSNIIEESGPDNDLYFILAGVVSIRVSGREIAVRTAGQHIGEMALLDPGQPRSAATVADGEVVVARIPAAAFAVLADANPRMWRNAARVLAERLRHRNRFVPPANPRPVMFVGCSTKALPIGRAIQSALEHGPIMVRVWTDDTFKASQFPVESLERELAKVDFAALVLSPDDTVISRDAAAEAPRDNLVFELGLFMGALGHSRTFLLHPRGSGIKIPTDLSGFTPLTYHTGSDVPNSVAVVSACEEMRAAILASGPRWPD